MRMLLVKDHVDNSVHASFDDLLVAYESTGRGRRDILSIPTALQPERLSISSPANRNRKLTCVNDADRHRFVSSLDSHILNSVSTDKEYIWSLVDQ
jgi:hypothetical protein